MAKFTLSLDDDYSFIVFGIAATTSDYKLCWSLNRIMKTALKREDPVEVYNKHNDKIKHSLYIFEDEELQIKYRLVENKKGGSRFLSEVDQADYLLVIDDSPAVQKEELQRKIREIKQVLLVFPVDLEALKHKQNLLLTA